MSTTLNFQLSHIPQTVVIFGCGGTGGRIVPPVAQLMSTLPTLINPELVLVDFDEVEEKNLSRQNFAKNDVGKNKAEALASRYSKAYNLKITPVTVAAGTDTYDEALSMLGLRDRLAGPALYIIAVDSVKARQHILRKALRCQAGHEHSSVVIDCGNEDIFGQVSWFTTGGLREDAAKDLEFIYNWYQGVIPGDITLNEWPVDGNYYFNMQEGESTKSCADLDQTLAINNLMAAQAIAIAQNILMGKTMKYWRVNFDLFHGVTFDALTIPELVRRAGSVQDGVGYHSSNQEARLFFEDLRSRMMTFTSRFSPTIAEMASSLEDEMLSDTPVRYDTSKIIRTSLGIGPFEPSLVFQSKYPDYYTEEYKAMWREGYVLPQPSEEDVRTYELAKSILEEMQAECDRLNAEEAARNAPQPQAEADIIQ